MPRKSKRKTPYAPLSEAARARLEPFRDMMGNRPDGDIAGLAGLDRRYVVVFRAQNGIPAYRRGSPPPDEKKPNEVRFRRSKLDQYRHLMGVVSDGQVAEQANSSREAVMRYRSRHGIPAAPRTPRVVPPPPQAEPATPRPAPIDELPPEPEDLSTPGATQAAQPVAVQPGHAAQGFIATVVTGGEHREYMVLGDDLAQACHIALDTVARMDAQARVLSLRYYADALL